MYVILGIILVVGVVGFVTYRIRQTTNDLEKFIKNQDRAYVGENVEDDYQ